MSYGPLSHSNQISYVIDPDGSLRNVSHLTQAAASENAFSCSSVARSLISSKPTGKIRERKCQSMAWKERAATGHSETTHVMLLIIFPDGKDTAHSHNELRQNNRDSTGSSII